jgi:hypothetical protein
MGWKDLPSWLKGVIVAVGVIILVLIIYPLLLFFNPFNSYQFQYSATNRIICSLHGGHAGNICEIRCAEFREMFGETGGSGDLSELKPDVDIKTRLLQSCQDCFLNRPVSSLECNIEECNTSYSECNTNCQKRSDEYLSEYHVTLSGIYLDSLNRCKSNCLSDRNTCISRCNIINYPDSCEFYNCAQTSKWYKYSRCQITHLP